MTNFILSSTFELTGLITSDFAPFLCLSSPPFAFPFFTGHGERNTNRGLFEDAFASLQDELQSLGVYLEFYGFAIDEEPCVLQRLGQYRLVNPDTGEDITVVYVKNRFDYSGQSHYDALMLCIKVLSERYPVTASKLTALQPRMSNVLLEMEKFNSDDDDL